MFNNISISSLENINFQINSKLGKQLEDLFQEMIDYKNSIDISNHKGIGLKDYVVDTFMSYFKKNFESKFKAIIKNNTGVDVISTVIDTNYVMNAWICPYRFDYSKPKPKKADEDLNVLFNWLNNILIFDDPKDPTKMGKYIDLVNSSVSKEISGKNSIYQYGAVIYFNPSFLFLSDIYFPITESKYNLTAKHITAIYLHELGHFFFKVVETSKIEYFEQKQLDHLDTVLTNVENTDKLVDFLLENKQKLLTMNNKPALVNETTFKVLEYYKELDKSNLALGILRTTLAIVKFIVINCIMLISSNALFSYPVFLLEHSITYLVNSIKANSNDPYDLPTTRNLVKERRDEQFADEFTSRQGYAAELVESLAIMSNLNDITYMNSTVGGNYPDPNIIIKVLRNVSLALGYLNFGLQAKTNFLNTVDIAHLENITRAKETLNKLIPIFKQKLDKTTANYFIDQFERVNKVANMYKNDKMYKTFKFLHNYILRTDILIILTTMVTTGRIENDLKNMLDTLDKLTNNKLYYYSTKFKQLT